MMKILALIGRAFLVVVGLAIAALCVSFSLGVAKGIAKSFKADADVIDIDPEKEDRPNAA